MSIRTQGRQLAAGVTVIVGVVSIAVTSIVSFALWRDPARSTTSVGPGGTSNSDDSSQSGFSNDGSGQLVRTGEPRPRLREPCPILRVLKRVIECW